MAKPKIYGPAARRRIDRTVQRDEARTDGSEPAGLPVGGGILPRTYRRFTLTEQLDAGGSAEVEWEDGESGTVYDRDTRCWGLEGETGQAAAVADDNGDVEWRVTGNPGQGIYTGSLAADATGTGAVNVTIAIDGTNRTVSAQLRAAPGTGKKWASGSICYVGHFRGSWEIASIVDCPVST